MTDYEQAPEELTNGENNKSSGGSRGSYGFRNNNGRCYNCGQSGHFSYDCNRGRGGNGFGGGFRSRGIQRCYNCQQEGHISRDCTNPPGAKSCYNCGGEGHISRDCTQPRKERSKNCFTCNEPGHIAANCTRYNN